MNIEETNKLLLMILSKFPSSLDISDKNSKFLVIGYFDELWRFSLSDAMAGARQAINENPKHAPSAPEIFRKCKKTLNVERFLDAEYWRIGEEIKRKKDELRECEKTMNQQIGEGKAPRISIRHDDLGKFCLELNERSRDIIKFYTTLRDKESELNEKIDKQMALLNDATKEAINRYDEEQFENARGDLEKFGITPTKTKEGQT